MNDKSALYPVPEKDDSFVEKFLLNNYNRYELAGNQSLIACTGFSPHSILCGVCFTE